MDPGARARTSGRGGQVVCPSCGKRSAPAPTCDKCGKSLQETRNPHSFRIPDSTDDLAEKLGELYFEKKDKAAAVMVSLRLLERASIDDETGRELRKGLAEVAGILFHKKLDLEYAWTKAFPTTKRGPKSRSDDEKGDR